MIRVLLEIPAEAPSELTVSGERFHYLAHVLRLGAGDAIEVFDGHGRAFAAKVERVESESLIVSLGAERRDVLEQRRITVVQGLPKGDKLEWIIEKATELGAAALVPVASEHAVVKLDEARAEKKRQRWQKIAEEAARQCGRADVPEIRPVVKLADAVKTSAAEGVVLILDESERSRRLSEALPPSPSPVTLVVGPEGGLSRAEVQTLAGLGAVPVTLGRNILRTETAALAAVSVIRHRDGNLG